MRSTCALLFTAAIVLAACTTRPDAQSDPSPTLEASPPATASAQVSESVTPAPVADRPSAPATSSDVDVRPVSASNFGADAAKVLEMCGLAASNELISGMGHLDDLADGYRFIGNSGIVPEFDLGKGGWLVQLAGDFEFIDRTYPHAVCVVVDGTETPGWYGPEGSIEANGVRLTPRPATVPADLVLPSLAP